jgi:hypothetical protein
MEEEVKVVGRAVEAMEEEAGRRGSALGVVATLATEETAAAKA